MKLISCHIDHFGTLSDKTIRFEPGVNVFCAENGNGKSTLCAFITAMLYGMETQRSGGKFGDREHYTPYGGGSFGGSLDFEADGATYHVERGFDVKSDAKDTLTVYRNGEKIDCESVGKTVFGIDRPAFERSFFTDSRDIEIEADGDVGAKLSAFLGGVQGTENVDEAVKKLEAAAKEYSKKRGNDDRISRTKEKIRQLNDEKTNACRVRDALPEKYEREHALSERIAALDAKIAEMRTSHLLRTEWEGYLDRKRRADDAAKERDELLARYPSGIPTAEELARIRADLNEKQKLDAIRATSPFGEEDRLRLDALRARFQDGTPDADTLSRIDEDIDALASLKRENAYAEDEKITALRGKFERRMPDENELGAMRAELEKAEKRTPIQGIAPKKPKTLCLALLVCGLSMIVCGCVLFAVTTVPAVIVLVAGFLALIGSAFLYLAKNTAQPMQNPEADEARITVSGFLRSYDYPLDRGLPFAFGSLENDLETLKNANEMRDRATKQAELDRAKADELREKITSFFRTYAYEGEGRETLNELRSDVKELTSLTERKRLAEEKETANEEKRAELDERLGAFAEKYEIEKETLASVYETVSADATRAVELTKRAEEDARAAHAYYEEKKLNERPKPADDENAPDVSSLEAERRALQSEESALALEIGSDESTADRVGDIENEIEEETEKLAVYTKRYALLNAAAEALRRSDRAVKERTVRPFRDRLEVYSAIVGSLIGDEIDIAPDLSIRILKNGKLYNDRHLSSGERSLCAFCYRLALIDGMYPGEKPFLILDDPFVHLDAAHLARLSELFTCIRANMQVLYFTCHESRILSLPPDGDALNAVSEPQTEELS